MNFIGRFIIGVKLNTSKAKGKEVKRLKMRRGSQSQAVKIKKRLR
jgi:hypothetical protein